MDKLVIRVAEQNLSKIKGIVDKVNAINPDVVLLAGDIIDDDEKYL